MLCARLLRLGSRVSVRRSANGFMQFMPKVVCGWVVQAVRACSLHPWNYISKASWKIVGSSGVRSHDILLHLPIAGQEDGWHVPNVPDQSEGAIRSTASDKIPPALSLDNIRHKVHPRACRHCAVCSPRAHDETTTDIHRVMWQGCHRGFGKAHDIAKRHSFPWRSDRNRCRLWQPYDRV